MSVFLTLTEGADSMEDASIFACRLAKRMKTKIQGLTAMPDPTGSLLMTGAGIGLYMPSSAQLIKSVQEAQDATRARQEEKFRAICETEHLAPEFVSVRHIEGFPSRNLEPLQFYQLRSFFHMIVDVQRGHMVRHLNIH